MIQIQHLTKYFANGHGTAPALDTINLTVQPGEIFAIIGRSGAGKSTLVRCINQLERPSHGSVIIDQQDLTQLSTDALAKARRQIGMVFQHCNLLTRRTVLQNIALPLELLGTPRSKIEQTIKPLIALTGLTDKQHAYPSQLSGGQKQRVAIARALATEPKVLLCDEMTSALDPESTQTILELIRDINQRLELSVLLITHEMEVVKAIANRVAVIDGGRIVEQGDVVSVFTNPTHPVTQSLVAATPLVLSPAMQQRLSTPLAHDAVIWQLSFCGEAAEQPVLSELLRQGNIELNILQAKLETVAQQAVGSLIAQVIGDSSAKQRARDFLMQRSIQVRELEYD